jgi:pyrimidine operon attenuation protein/uracil phosphoribosyltransferase
MNIVLDAPSMARAITRMAHEVLEKNKGTQNLAFLGIQTRGVILAQRLQKEIQTISKNAVPVGILDINLYRDDLTRVAEQPIIHKTEISFPLDDMIVVLVDDVLYTGCTVRAALNAIVDFGRPKRIELAVLIDRGHRELPIKAEFVGKNIPTSENETVHVHFMETDKKEEVMVASRGH